MKGEEKSRLIFSINFDWRDLYRCNQEEFREKLQRDQLRPDINAFFFFSWGKTKYKNLEEPWRTIHARTFGLEKVRPLLNLITAIRIPYTAWRYRIRPDVWLAYDFGMVPALWIARRMFGGHLIMLLNNQPHKLSRTRNFGSIKGWYSFLMERMFVGLPEHYLTLNETMQVYLAKLGVPHEKITVFVVNTVERDAQHIMKADPDWLRATYHIPKDKKILLTVARLEVEKDHALLLDLVAKLPHEYVLMCLGEGRLRPQLEEQIGRLKLGDRVMFLGNVTRKDIWNYYVGADTFVLLSKAEALGIVFWEAMYVGLPVVGRNVDGIIESLGKDGDRGRVWSETDGPEGFAEKIRFCATDSGDRDAMINRAKMFVDQQLTNHANLNAYLDDYEL